MTSFLIISEDKEKANEKALTLCDGRGIDSFDRMIFDLTTSESKSGVKKSWGIDDIKELKKKIILKPGKGEWKAIILQDAQLLTLEAQNALLKLLEEPPSGTLIFLIASTKEALLPTILSRCSVIELKTELAIQKINNDGLLEEIHELTNSSIGYRLKKAEILSKNKEEALEWIKRAAITQHGLLQKNHTSILAGRLRLLNESYRVIHSTNVNLRLALESLFFAVEIKRIFDTISDFFYDRSMSKEDNQKGEESWENAEEEDFLLGEIPPYVNDHENSVGAVLIDRSHGQIGLEEAADRFVADPKNHQILDHAKKTGKILIAKTTTHGKILYVAGAVVAAGITGYKIVHHLQSPDEGK